MGLTDRTRYEVESKSPSSLEPAIATAPQYEHLTNTNSYVETVNTISIRNNRRNQGTNSGSKRYYPASSEPHSSKPSCSYFNRRGHSFNDCFSRKNSLSQSNSSAYSSRLALDSHSGLQRHATPQTGYNGRTQRVINSLHTNNSDQLLRVHGTLAHVPNLLCTLHSASTVSMMTESTAHQYGILPSDIQIKSANNAVTSVVGITERLKIDIHGRSCQLSFVILKHDDHELLLGIDWFKLTGASLHPSDLVLKLFHNPDVLDDDHDVSEAPILSSIVYDEDDIDFDMDWFTTNDISMTPSETLNEAQTVEFENLKRASIKSFATAYDS